MLRDGTRHGPAGTDLIKKDLVEFLFAGYSHQRTESNAGFICRDNKDPDFRMLSAYLHLGADRLLIIGVRNPAPDPKPAAGEKVPYPTIHSFQMLKDINWHQDCGTTKGNTQEEC